jgi:hypothetical protein
MDYPEKPCVNHPSRMWEWDGYGWICVGCILQDPPEEIAPLHMSPKWSDGNG